MILADNDSSQDVSLDVQSQSEHESMITNSGLSPQPACCKSNIFSSFIKSNITSGGFGITA
jgi:hypothetical protein